MYMADLFSFVLWHIPFPSSIPPQHGNNILLTLEIIFLKRFLLYKAFFPLAFAFSRRQSPS